MIRYLNKELQYTKKRKDFGREPLFQVVPAHLIDSIPPNRALQREYILRNPVHREVQATLPQSINDSNTPKVVMVEQCINHTEGGWPKEIQLNNEEQVERHKRRVKHEDNYIRTVMNLSPLMSHYVHQNNAIDMYQSYYADIPEIEPAETYCMRVATVFRDPRKRPVSCLQWTNKKNSKLVVSHRKPDMDPENAGDKDNLCAVWDVLNQNKPVSEFLPQYPCWKVACSPVDPDILVAGLDNGTVSLFDLRSGPASIADTSPFNSHRESITALLYTHSRTNTEFLSGSPDGQCLWWDTRNLSEPIEQIPMSVKMAPNVTPNLGNAEGVSCLNYDRGVPTRFLCGTDSGLVINGNRMGRSHSEVLTMYWDAHTGPVRTIQRSPCTLRMFITCSDWSVRIWSEEVRTAPIIVFKPFKYRVNDVAWAPTRYSSFLAVDDSGALLYWDLLRNCENPTTSINVSKCALTNLVPHVDGHIMATGNKAGSVSCVQLSENMVIPGDNDKALVFQMYLRETKREHILDNRLKEIRLKQKAEEEAEGAPPIEEQDEELLVEEAEEEFWNIVNRELHEMEGSIAASF